MILNVAKAPNYKHADQMPIDIRIDGTSFDLSELYDTDSTLSSSKNHIVTGTVETEARNATSDVTAFFRGAGYAMNDTGTIETCQYDGVTCYRAKVMPTVSAISHNEGYAVGGQTLTITGTSLDGAAVTVTVDGLACEVQTISVTELTCITSAKTIDPDAVAPLSYIGQQGLNRYRYGAADLHRSWRPLIDTEDQVSKMIWTAIDIA